MCLVSLPQCSGWGDWTAVLCKRVIPPQMHNDTTHRARDGMSNSGVHSSSPLLHGLRFSSVDGRSCASDDAGSMTLHSTSGPRSSHCLDEFAIMYII
jgi:hypothetical protein